VIRWLWLLGRQRLREMACQALGRHRLNWYHPQQDGCECSRCKWIIGRDGVSIISGPL